MDARVEATAAVVVVVILICAYFEQITTDSSINVFID